MTGRVVGARGLRFCFVADICCVALAKIGSKHHASFNQKLLNTAGQFMQELAC